jgi:hypothetical protein
MFFTQDWIVLRMHGAHASAIVHHRRDLRRHALRRTGIGSHCDLLEQQAHDHYKGDSETMATAQEHGVIIRPA